jgi:hypothetical protein
MENLDEKAIIRITAEGVPSKCAKNLDLKDCGYKPGSKICGKCGAMAVQIKEDDMPEEEEVMEAEEAEEKAVDAEEAAVDLEVDEDGDVIKCAKSLAPAKCGYKAGDDECGACGATPKTKGVDEEVEKQYNPDGSPIKPMEEDAEEKYSDEDMGEEPMGSMNTVDRRRRLRARRNRMETMKVKSADWDNDAFLCGFESKMMPGAAKPCAACPGGCAPEGDLPTLLEVQGLAEEMLNGKVLDSGYADAADVFVVDVHLKSGKIAEAVFDGSTAECLGWQLLDENLLSEKSAMPNMEIISIDTASEVATKTIFGDVVHVDADMFEGYDAYAVEINGVDGKSYDVFVSLDGEVLGYDAYEMDEQKSADLGLEAELKIKKMYTQPERDEMAKEGIAMPDGSLPIADADDLKNAVQAFGRAKDKKKARAHIMKRARALAEDGLIPENWMSGVKKSFGENASDEEKAVIDNEFLADLMEFQLLAEEADIKSPSDMAQEEKREYSEESREEMAESEEALPDGSYPIADEADLRNAIQAYGRAKDKEAAKAHIMKRASDLGLEDLIPEGWVDGEEKSYDEEDEMMEESEEKSDDLLASLEEFNSLLEAETKTTETD